MALFQVYPVDGRGRLGAGSDIQCRDIDEACARVVRTLCAGGRAEIWDEEGRAAILAAYSLRDVEVIKFRLPDEPPSDPPPPAEDSARQPAQASGIVRSRKRPRDDEPSTASRTMLKERIRLAQQRLGCRVLATT